MESNLAILVYFLIGIAIFSLIYYTFFYFPELNPEAFLKSKAKQRKVKEKFMFETDPDMDYPISQIRLDNMLRPPCRGGFVGRPVYFDYTSSTDVASTCGETIADEDLGKDAGFRGRRLLSRFNCRDPMIV